MRKKTRSILDEISSMVSDRDRKLVLESRATHIINSAINLIQTLSETYNEQESAELERRFLNSIRGKDPKKFIRGIRKIQDED